MGIEIISEWGGRTPLVMAKLVETSADVIVKTATKARD
jgi:hypothetical protein